MSENRKKCVAILTNYPVDGESFTGGVETATAALLEGLMAYQNEFEFHIVSVSISAESDIFERRDGFWFHFLSVPSYPWLRPRLPFRVIRACQELRRIRPHLVHCQGNLSLALATIIGGYPRLFTIHGVAREEANKRTGWEFWSTNLDALIERFIHYHFNTFICISNYSARVVGNGRLTFDIPNPVRSQFFQMLPCANFQESPYFLFVGVLAPLKRPSDLLLAHAELRRYFPNLKTVFCGEKEDVVYTRSMNETIVERGIEGIHFLGYVSQRRLFDLLSGAVALVLPSAQENAPMIIAEAMAVGIPVVATRVGGIPDMVKHGETGLLYDSGDIHALTNSLRHLLDVPSLREDMGSKARKIAEITYSPVRAAKATVTVYRKLLREQSVL